MFDIFSLLTTGKVCPTEIYRVEVSDTAKPPIIHRTGSLSNELSPPNASSVTVEKPEHYVMQPFAPPQTSLHQLTTTSLWCLID